MILAVHDHFTRAQIAIVVCEYWVEHVFSLLCFRSDHLVSSKGVEPIVGGSIAPYEGVIWFTNAEGIAGAHHVWLCFDNCLIDAVPWHSLIAH